MFGMFILLAYIAVVVIAYRPFKAAANHRRLNVAPVASHRHSAFYTMPMQFF